MTIHKLREFSNYKNVLMFKMTKFNILLILYVICYIICYIIMSGDDYLILSFITLFYGYYYCFCDLNIFIILISVISAEVSVPVFCYHNYI